jgi:hypothetical protein
MALAESPEWRRLCKIACDLGLRDGLELPMLHIDWDDGRAWFRDEKPYPHHSLWDYFDWFIGKKFVLRHTVGAKQFRNRYDLAIFDGFADLADDPPLGRSTLTMIVSSAGNRSDGIVLLQRRAAVVLCTRRVVELVEEGRLVDIVTAQLEKRVSPGWRP